MGKEKYAAEHEREQPVEEALLSVARQVKQEIAALREDVKRWRSLAGEYEQDFIGKDREINSLRSQAAKAEEWRKLVEAHNAALRLVEREALEKAAIVASDHYEYDGLSIAEKIRSLAERGPEEKEPPGE